jgi:hypothetical protein
MRLITPGPPAAYGLEAKDVPRLPRLGFPPWNPSSEAPPPYKGIPKGGHPSATPGNLCLAFAQRGRGLGGGSRDPRPPGRPYGVTPFADSTPLAFPSVPSEGTPSALSRWRPSVTFLCVLSSRGSSAAARGPAIFL